MQAAPDGEWRRESHGAAASIERGREKDTSIEENDRLDLYFYTKDKDES